MNKNLPEAKISIGPICATIWNNEAEDKTSFNTISFERRYKAKNNEWKTTNSLRFNDLPKASLVLNKAYEYLAFKNKTEGSMHI